MSRIIVLGGSIAGLGTALLAADRGHQVVVLDRASDPAPVTPAEASVWKRPTVPQYQHSHAFASLTCNLLRERAPDVWAALLDAGCQEINLADYPPPTLTDFERAADDDDLRMVLARRSTFELVLRERALARPNVTMVAPFVVRSLVVSEDDPTRIIGARDAAGTEVTGDLVVDATGRRTEVGGWLTALDLPAPVTTASSSRIVYYTRHYRQLSPTPPGPLNRGFGAGGLWDSYTAVLFRGDNGHFSISLGILPEDDALKGLKDEDAFTAAVRATPLLAGWVAPGASTSVSGVYVMAGLDNSLRLPAPGDVVPTGLFGIGDAACTTNPSNGRGVSLALSHAALLTDLLDRHPTVDSMQTTQFVDLTTAHLRPWFEEAVAGDAGRAGLWEATLAQRPPQRPPQGVVTFGTAVAASTSDATVWRQVARTMMMLSPPRDLYGNPDIGRRIGQALAGGPPRQLPGATHSDLVAAVTPPQLRRTA